MQQSIIKEFENNPDVVTVLYNQGGRQGETEPWLKEIWSNFYLRGDIIFDETGENSIMNYNQADTGLPFGRSFIIDQSGNVVLPYFSHQADLAVETIYSLLDEPGDTQWRAYLRGQEVVPPVSTTARGRADFVKVGQFIRYILRLRNIQDISGFHIHCAARGYNGPVGVTLSYAVASPAGKWTEEVDVHPGSFTEPDAGNDCNWESLSDVEAAMSAGLAYVSVHTIAYPDGEVRGQVKAIP